MSRRSVVVVGAGVIGLSTAVHLLEKFPGEIELTVISEEFSPNTTTDRAGMIMFPVDLGIKSKYNQDESIKRWARHTFQKFHSIYRSEENAKVEICLEHGYLFLSTPSPDPWWKEEVFGFRHVELDSLEASVINLPPDCKIMWSFSAYIVNPTSYITWLLQKVKIRGANIVKRKISSLDQLTSSYDIVINCTGLGSCGLVGDNIMYPVRGQVVLVKAPWVKSWVVHYWQDGVSYVFPRARNVVLGGTAQPGDFRESPDPDTAMEILERCQKLVPSLSDAEVIKEWAGLRPARDPIRLESCKGDGGSLIIHCYGHGGGGIVLSWGCAVEVGDIVQQRLQSKARL